MLGFNYKKHVMEVKVPMPTAPVLFNKYNNSLLAHQGTIRLPTKVAKKFDYESSFKSSWQDRARRERSRCLELRVRLRQRQRLLSPRSAAPRRQAGLAVHARQDSRWVLPGSPYLVGANIVGDPQKLGIECRVNGEQRQSSNTSDMIFPVAQIIAYASSIFTLKPGDIFSTGTPEGVILGKPEPEQVWLKAGDNVACSVEKLGELSFNLA